MRPATRELWRERDYIDRHMNLRTNMLPWICPFDTRPVLLMITFFQKDANTGRGQRGASQKKQKSMTQYLESADESPSQKSSKVPQISDEQVLEQARKVVYFLVSSVNEGSAINRTDIQKTVLKNFHTKHYPTIMAKAAEVLKDVRTFVLFYFSFCVFVTGYVWILF